MTASVATSIKVSARARLSGDAPDRSARGSASLAVIGRAFGIAKVGGCGHVHATAEKAARRKTKVEIATERREPAAAKKIKAALDRAKAKIVRQVVDGFERHVAHTIAQEKLAKDLSPGQQRAIDDLLAQIDADQVGIAVREALGPELDAIFREAGIAGVAEVGFDAGPEIVNHVDVAATEYAATRGAELVTRISETTRDDLRDLVGRAVEDGWSSQTLGDAIEESAGFSEYRSFMIARTELAFAHVQGNMEGWRQTGMVEAKRWLASEDACPICDDLDGEEVDFDETFDFDGEAIDAPPGHPNCRCDVLPVLKPEEGGE